MSGHKCEYWKKREGKKASSRGVDRVDAGREWGCEEMGAEGEVEVNQILKALADSLVSGLEYGQSAPIVHRY